MTTFDLLETALLLRDDMQEQFEYWLGITFAVIISSYFAGSRIHLSWRLTIGCLYLLATALFSTRFLMSSRNFQYYLNEAIAEVAYWVDTAGIMYSLRSAILVVGTLATVWFLYANSKIHENST